MVHQDLLWLRLHSGNIGQKLLFGRMPRKALCGLNIHLHRICHILAFAGQGYLLSATLNLLSKRTICLISYENKCVLGVGGPCFEILHYRPAVHHTGGGKHDCGLRILSYFLPLSLVSTFLNIGLRNGFSFFTIMASRSSLLRYSGYAACIAGASIIIPSR
ncbi:hypothetical protein [Thermoplasma acidophilum]|uniref:Uncharacterized protein n=1 Tax=Thermoplasma acidophilum (strain ATCC 25905 / DSM 1728 / JCM 9062 / NBRC 15155 / AMRC-C165) TaxID=273075 RepID=Q9HKI5_THEAC|nr:hypothetical protein [Thermoplasma acidophilum]